MEQATPRSAARNSFGDIEKKIENIGELPDKEKIGLIDQILSSDLPNKSGLLEKAFSGTQLTDGFLHALAECVLSNQPMRDVNSASEQKSLFKVTEHLEDMAKISPFRAGRKLAAINEETQSFLLVGLLLNDTVCKDARVALAGSMRLNEKVYSSLKTHIKTSQACDIGQDLERKYPDAAADFVLGFNSSDIKKLDDGGCALLCKTLLDVSNKNPVSKKWDIARFMLFDEIPVPMELQKFHQKMGIKYVEHALNNPELVKLSTEALVKWDSPEWKNNTDHKKRFFEAIIAPLAAFYSLEAPLIEFSDKLNGVEALYDRVWVKDEKQESGRKMIGRLSLNKDGQVADSFMHKAMDSLTHEMGHDIETNVIKGKGIAANNESLRPASQILALNSGSISSASQYISSEQDKLLYYLQPSEKHARWFGDHMVKNFHVIINELLERFEPGTYMKGALPIVDSTMGMVKTLEPIKANLSPEQASRFDSVLSQGASIKSSYKAGQPVSLKQIEGLQSYFEQAGPMCELISKTFLGESGDSMKELISSLSVNEYAAYKRYEATHKSHDASSSKSKKRPVAIRRHRVSHLKI